MALTSILWMNWGKSHHWFLYWIHTETTVTIWAESGFFGQHATFAKTTDQYASEAAAIASCQGEIDLSHETKTPENWNLRWHMVGVKSKTATSARKWAGKVPDRCCIFYDTEQTVELRSRFVSQDFGKIWTWLEIFITWKPWCNDDDLNIIYKSNTNLQILRASGPLAHKIDLFKFKNVKN